MTGIMKDSYNTLIYNCIVATLYLIIFKIQGVVFPENIY